MTFFKKHKINTVKGLIGLSLSICLLAGVVQADPPTMPGFFKYNYDAGGNRISRIYHAATPPPKAVAQAEEESNISIYPNPVQDDFYVGIPEIKNYKEVSFELYDTKGTLVLERKKVSNTTTKLTLKKQLANGTYFLNITTDGVVKSYKILKSK